MDNTNLSVGPLNKVLVVEDEEDIRMILQLALEDVGNLNICLCASGKEAILQTPLFKPQLLLLDLMMPEMDGSETLQAIRALPGFEQIPCIFLTAKIPGKNVDHLKTKDVLAIISKPFEPMTIAEQVKKYWNMQKSC